jgi:3-hydroxyacyl-CoA dehydrogenase
VERIGFVGLGIMGSRMAANLRRAGAELTVYNRTRKRAEAWAAEHGGTVVPTPAEVGAASDVRRARRRERCASTCRPSRRATAAGSRRRSPNATSASSTRR